MNQLPCEIVKDLLPLYVDNVCSEQSMNAVEEHLSTCEKCREVYDAMREKPPDVVTEESTFEKDIAFVKRQWKIKTGFPIIFIGCIVLAILTISVFFSPQMDSLFLISPEKIHVTELYKLRDGNIYCTLKSEQDFKIAAPSVVFISEEDRIKGIYDNGQINISLYSNTFGSMHSATLAHSECSFLLPLKEKDYSMSDAPGVGGVYLESSKIYYKGKYNQKKLIWEKGQAIKSAPETIEKKVEAEREREAAISGQLTEEIIYPLTFWD